MDDAISVHELAKSVTVSDAVSWVKTAWNEVKLETIRKCFVRCGFQSSVVDESVNGSDDASDYVPDLIQLGQVVNVAVEVSAIDEEIPCFNENWDDIIPEMNPEPDGESENEEENIEPIHSLK
ncbi:hypothetical protein C0J52_28422 [Blattella germanica]|nr:hypothetical protein C0J52_28422 [Blattella germanica]